MCFADLNITSQITAFVCLINLKILRLMYLVATYPFTEKFHENQKILSKCRDASLTSKEKRFVTGKLYKANFSTSLKFPK